MEGNNHFVSLNPSDGSVACVKLLNNWRYQYYFVNLSITKMQKVYCCTILWSENITFVWWDRCDFVFIVKSILNFNGENSNLYSTTIIDIDTDDINLENVNRNTQSTDNE